VTSQFLYTWGQKAWYPPKMGLGGTQSKSGRSRQLHEEINAFFLLHVCTVHR